jgi:hypothetical protein
MSRPIFVKKCGELLRIAKPNLISCELVLGKDIPRNYYETYFPNDEYVIITCANGHKYVCCVTANSLHEIALEIFKSMRDK